MNQSLAEKLALACRLLYMEGLVDHGGLVGARIPATGNLILNPREMCGTTGRHPGLMTAEDMVVVDPQGARVAGTNNPPSGIRAELPVKLGAQALNPVLDTPEQLGEGLKSLRTMWAAFIQRNGIAQDQ